MGLGGRISYITFIPLLYINVYIYIHSMSISWDADIATHLFTIVFIPLWLIIVFAADVILIY